MLKRKFRPSPSCIGPKMEVHGNLFLDEDLYVEGILHGSLETSGVLKISNFGLVEGKEIKAHQIIIEGILKAEKIIAEGLILISRTGRVEGQIITNSISVEEGAIVHATIQSQEICVPQLPPECQKLEGALNLDANLITPVIRDWRRDDFFVPN